MIKWNLIKDGYPTDEELENEFLVYRGEGSIYRAYLGWVQDTNDNLRRIYTWEYKEENQKMVRLVSDNDYWAIINLPEKKND